MAGGVWTYDDTSRREDLLSILRDVSPISDNYLVTNLEDAPARQTLHEWVVDHIARPTTTNFFAEGTDFAEEDNDQPTRSHNITAIVKRSVKVTGTAQKVDVALKQKPLEYQKVKQLRRLKADMEYATVNGVKASGASGTARAMAGLQGAISTNMTARSSGTSMSVNELEDIIQNSWDNVGAEFVADLVLVPMGIKRKIATFTTRVTHNVDSTERIYNNMSVFEGSAGTVKVIPHRDVNNAAGTTHVYAIREEMYRLAFLRRPFWNKYAQDGDHERGEYITEFTLESLAQRTSVKRTGYNLLG